MRPRRGSGPLASFAAAIATLLLGVLLPALARAGVRVDEAGPPRPPRVPRERVIEESRVPRLEITAGPASLAALGVHGGGWMVSAAIGGSLARHASGVVRLEYGSFEELHWTGARTADIREGRVDAARSGELSGVSAGVRAGGLGRSHTWIEARAGVARTRLEHVAIETVTTSEWRRYEDRTATRATWGLSMGHRWPIASFPIELMTELAGNVHVGRWGGSDLALRIGLLGAGPSREEP